MGDEGMRQAATDAAIDELTRVSVTALRLLGAVVRGQASNPFDVGGDPIAVLSLNDRIEVAQHLLEHAGPLAQQLGSLRSEPGA